MTSNAKIVVTSRTFCQVPSLCEELIETFPNTTLNTSGAFFQRLDLIEFLKEADGILLGTEAMDREVIDALPKVKIISKYGVGLDNIDLDYAKQAGKIIGSTGGVNRRSVAEQTLSFMIGMCRNLFWTGYQMKNGDWDKNGGFQLSGKKVGIIGCGFTGGEVAKRLSGFDVTVLGYDKYKKGFSNNYVVESTMDRIYEEADIISLHLPLTDETHFMVNNEFIERFNKDIYIINTSRGKVIYTEDLVNNLKSGKVRGACLDVLEYESTSFERLKGLGIWTNNRGRDINKLGAWLMKKGVWKYRHPVQYLVKSKKVILSPHIAGWSVESYRKIAMILADRIRELNLHP